MLEVGRDGVGSAPPAAGLANFCDPARRDGHEARKVTHYYLSVDALWQPMEVRQDSPPYGGEL